MLAGGRGGRRGEWQIKKIFKYAERKYILNTLYIDKFILWVQVRTAGAIER